MLTLVLTDIIVAGIAVLFSFIRWRQTRAIRLPLPPGPPGLPILGNAFDLPEEREWLTYADWQKTYGDLIYLNVLGQSFLIVSSPRVASDLTEKRSAIYSDRMKMPFFGDLVGWGWAMLLQEGAAHREYRRLAHRGMNPLAVKQYRSMELGKSNKSKRTLMKFLEGPADFVQHFKFHVGSAIMKLAYGGHVKEDGDCVLALMNKVMEEFAEAAVPGKHIVDFIPWLKLLPSWLPGLESHRTAGVWRERLERAVNLPFNSVEEQMDKGMAEHCLTTLLLETKGDALHENIK